MCVIGMGLCKVVLIGVVFVVLGVGVVVFGVVLIGLVGVFFL